MNTIRAIVKNGAVLGGVAALTAGLIASIWLQTEPLIEASVRAAEARQLEEIFPPASHSNDLLDDSFIVPANTSLLELRKPRQGYRVRQGNDVVGVILPATARDGYSGDIELLVGIRKDGSVAGVRVVGHRETPGLGDGIERRKSAWILSFNDQSLLQPVTSDWQVRKDGGVFDQFTGATITPRAVVNAVRKTLEYSQIHEQTLFTQAPDEAASAKPLSSHRVAS